MRRVHMFYRLIQSSALTLAALLSAPSAHAAPTRPRVAVLYFDNNTGNKSFDVLQKGFADMMITDLSQIRDVVVVERDKLQALVKEIKLQRSKYFNKRTALKLGKGLGAQYAIAGAFAAVEPQVRIDARLMDVARGTVVLAAKVVGKKDEIFQLEQQLVAKLAAKLRGRFRPGGNKATKVPNMKTLLDYSKGIALVDKGKLASAKLRIAAVAKLAPRFKLARIRVNDVQGKLERAAKRRELTISAFGLELEKRARAFIRKHSSKEAIATAKRYLMYRQLLSWVQLRRIRQHLSTARPSLLLDAKRKRVLPMLVAYAKGRQRLLKDLDAYSKAHSRQLPDGRRYLDGSLRLPADEAHLAVNSGFRSSARADPTQARLQFARFLLLGRAHEGGKLHTFAPPLAELKPRYRTLAYAMLRKVAKAEDARVRANPVHNRPNAAIDARLIHGQALLLRGKRDKAVAKWQEVIDTYPTARQYKTVERRIKQQLGLVHHHARKNLARYKKGLAGCGDMDLRVGMRTVMSRRLRLMGLKGVLITIAEIEKHCRKDPKARRVFRSLFSSAALKAGRHGECKLFESLMGRFLAEGGSPRSVQGYRRNYTSCPEP